jgi:hypothetical protein
MTFALYLNTELLIVGQCGDDCMGRIRDVPGGLYLRFRDDSKRQVAVERIDERRGGMEKNNTRR